MYHHGQTPKYINILPGNKENTSQLTDSQELKKTPIWAPVGHAKDKHKALTNQWKRYAIVVMESEVWPTVNFMHFLFHIMFFIAQHDKWNWNNLIETWA